MVRRHHAAALYIKQTVIYYICPRIMTGVNVPATVGMSTTVGEMSTTVGVMSATVGECLQQGRMSATVGKFNMVSEI